jgi:riboflavin biosynthesis pyrimidine reductase
VTLRRLLPTPSDGIDAVDAYLPPSPTEAGRDSGGRPWTMVNMVSSLDGAVTVEGRSAGLSSPLDKEIFAAMRSVVDVVMVGAGTARTERYGPVRLRDDHASRRVERGQSEVPDLVVVSRSGDLGTGLPMFNPEVASSTPRPIVLTCEAGRSAVEPLGDAAEIWVCGDDDVDLSEAMRQLGERGVRSLLSEGGPGLNASMLRDGLIDELCLTVAPLLVGGPAGRIVAGDGAGLPADVELHQLLESEAWLFGRWRLGGPRA